MNQKNQDNNNNKNKLTDLEQIKQDYQRVEENTLKFNSKNERKYIYIMDSLFYYFLVGYKEMMKQDSFIRLKNTLDNYKGENNIDKEKKIFNEIIYRATEIQTKGKEDYDYSRELLEDLLNNCKKNIQNDSINTNNIIITFERLCKVIIKEKKEAYINYEKQLINFKDLIKDLCLSLKI